VPRIAPEPVAPAFVFPIGIGTVAPSRGRPTFAASVRQRWEAEHSNLQPLYNLCMAELGKLILGLGLLLVVLGGALMLGSRLGLPIGRLPGDFHWRSRSGHTQVYFPLMTCIVLSVLLTLILWLVNSFRK
jgi:Protein of unknown function (DUF2905)